jgi:hypothetical protein
MLLLRVEVQMCAVDLIESPQKVLGGAIDVVASRVIWEIIAEG